MRMRIKLLAVMGLGLIAMSSAVAETAPAPAAAYPYGYVNPFDPNWWLMTFNNMARLYTVPGSTGYALPAAPAPGTVASTAPSAYPYGYVNPFDPNWWLSAAPTGAGQAAAAPAATMASPYVPVETPYGRIQVFNYADPAAWNKLFAQPFAMPGQ